jgi:hypothetical protein
MQLSELDAHLGRPVPLVRAPLGLVRWTDLRADGPGAVEVAWNLDDSRGGPGRLALRASAAGPGEDRGLGPAEAVEGFAVRRAALQDAQPSLRPAVELAWEADGLHLRLTAQGPWALSDLLALARSIS